MCLMETFLALILPKLLTDTELRDFSREMLSREKDDEIKLILEEYILDLQLEGDEFEKNKYLAPAEPIPSRDKEIMQSESSKKIKSAVPIWL